MRNLFYRKKYLQVVFSVVISFLFVATVTYGATTISTSINTAGTLTVSGVSTLTGAATFSGAIWASSTAQVTGVTTLYNNLVVDTNTLLVDSTNNRVGIGTTTPVIELAVSGDGYFTGGLGLGSRNAVDSTLVLTGLTANPAGVSGMIYYNSTDEQVKLYNGSVWGVIGTSTGFTLSGRNIKLADVNNSFVTFGTTTAQGASLATLEATSTLAIPLTLVGYASQAANLFQIRDAASANLLYVNSAGALFGSSTAQFTSPLTTYGSDVLGDAVADTLTINGGTVAMGNRATTTIINNFLNAFSIATSTSITPTFSIDTSNGTLGRVGIGTLTPSALLDVAGSARLGSAVGDTLTVNAGTVAMSTRATTTIQNLLINAFSIATSTSITPTFSIDTSRGAAGRIGVGTTSPGATFAITGDAYFTGVLTTDGSSVLGDAVGDTLTVNAGTFSMGNRATTTIINNFLNAFSIATSTGITPTFSIDTSNGALGRVGIGTLAPSALLDVAGSFIANSSTTLGSSVTDRLTLQTGIVAMGTRSTTTVPNAIINVWSIATSTDVTPTLTIDTSTGRRVGVNTTAPTATFNVEGSVTFNDNQADYDFRVEGDSQDNLLQVDASVDRIGIATSTPYATFSVEKRDGEIPFAVGDYGSSSPYLYVDRAGKTVIATSSPIGGIRFGTCTVIFAPTLFTESAEGNASTSNCVASGVTASDAVFMTPANLEPFVVFNSASSTGNDIIKVQVFNSTTTDITVSGKTWYWMAIR